MTRFARGTYDADKFKKEFGIQAVSAEDAMTKGSSTGAKNVDAIGHYLDEKTYNRLKNDDKVWKAYGSVFGKKEAAKKREKGALTINALDGLMDRLSAEKPEAEPTPEPPKPMKDIVLSPEAQKINQTVKDWEFGANNYIRAESPFAQGAKEEENGDSRDNQESTQEFMSSYKNSLKDAMNFRRTL